MAYPATDTQETLRLEGFSDSLRDHRIFCVVPTGGAGASAPNPKFAETFLRTRMAALDAEVVHRGRKVLLFQGGAAEAPRWLKTLGWDAEFFIRDANDLKLALTFIQHAGRPTRVAWVGPPPAIPVMRFFHGLEGTTLLCVHTAPPAAAPAEMWHAVFWSPQATVEDVEATVTHRMGAQGMAGLRSILRELHGSNVGLVWSSIGESEKRGSLYWYDPEEGRELRPHVSPAEAVEMLRAVAEMLGGSTAAAVPGR